MPNHQTHDQIGAYAAAALLPASYAVLTLALDEPPAVAYSGALVVICAHLWATWMLSPDLDIDSAIYDRWGPFRWLWLPYQKIIPHRSWFSHSGVSGALRLLYLGAALWCALYLLGELGRVVFGLAGVPAYHEQFFAWLTGTLAAAGPRPVWLIVAGVVVADMVHVAADLITSEIKGFWRGAGRRS
jgi:uncharacterized metal-binding protein